MSKKIDERLPKEVGTGFYPVKSPWDKMISYREAAHYCQRYTNVVSAVLCRPFAFWFRIMRSGVRQCASTPTTVCTMSTP